jgi:O-antigen ligase
MKVNYKNLNYDAPLLSALLSLLIFIAIPISLFLVAFEWGDSVERQAVIGVGVISLSFIAIKREKYYLLILAFLFLSQFSISLRTFELSPPERLSLHLFDLVLFLLVWTAVERKEKWSFDGLARLFVVFIIWEIAATLNSAHFDRSLVHTHWLIKYLLIYLIALNMPFAEKINNKIPLAVTIILVMQALLGMLQYVRGDVLGLSILGEASGASLNFVGESLRISGTAGGTNSYAGYMAMLLVFLAPFMVVQKKIFYYGVFSLGCVALLLSFSRAGWLSLIVGVNIVLILLLYNKLIRFTRILMFAIFISAVIAGLMYAYTDQIMERFTSDEAISSAKTRIIYSDQAFEAISDYPIFGIGPGVTQYFGRWNDFQEYVRNELPSINLDNQVHNGHLQIWMEGGVPAFILWSAIILYAVFSLNKTTGNYKNNQVVSLLKIGSGAAAIAVLLHISFGTEINNYRIMAVFWFLLGLNRNIQSIQTDNKAS